MSNEIKASFDLSTKEGKRKAFNAQNGSALSMKDMENGEVINVTAVMIHEGVNSDGEVNTVTTLFTEDGACASISATVSKAAENLIDFMEDGETVPVRIIKAKSKGNREFLNLQLV